MARTNFLLFLYAYLGTLAGSFFIFWLVLKRPLIEASPLNPFEMVTLRTPEGKERQATSGLLSGVAVIALMAGMLVALWGLAQLIGSWVTTLFILLDYTIAAQFTSAFQLGQRIPWIRERPWIARIFNWIAALILGVAWLPFPGWITYNVAFIVIVYVIMQSIGAVRLRTFLIVFSMLVLFDIWGVFISGLIIKVALELPIQTSGLLYVPLYPWKWNSQPLMGLGSGDVLLAGVAMLTAKRYNLHWYVIVGYAIGVLSIMLVGFLIPGPLPALITLVPSILTCFLIGYFKNKWNGTLPVVTEPPPRAKLPSFSDVESDEVVEEAEETPETIAVASENTLFNLIRQSLIWCVFLLAFVFGVNGYYPLVTWGIVAAGFIWFFVVSVLRARRRGQTGLIIFVHKRMPYILIGSLLAASVLWIWLRT